MSRRLHALLRLPARIFRHLRRMGPLGDPLRVPYRWLRKPDGLTDREVCLFMTFDRSGDVPRHARDHATAWVANGYVVVMIIAVDDLKSAGRFDELDFAGGIILRENVGYDFGAWASVIRLLPELSHASRLAIVNDSVYGPLGDFKNVLDRVRATSADFVGAIESFEFKPHIQSFLVFFNFGALRSRVFWKFWRSVRLGNREQVIRDYELRLSQRLQAGGLAQAILFPAPSGYTANPTIRRWRELVYEGFPYIKRQVLRQNDFASELPTWQEVVAERGFDHHIIEQHLRSLNRPAD